MAVNQANKKDPGMDKSQEAETAEGNPAQTHTGTPAQMAGCPPPLTGQEVPGGSQPPGKDGQGVRLPG